MPRGWVGVWLGMIPVCPGFESEEHQFDIWRQITELPKLSQCRLLTEVLIQIAPSLEMGKSSAYHLVPISQLMGQRHKPVKQVGLFPNENQMCWIPLEYWVHSLSRVLASAEGCPYLIFTTNQPQHSFTWKISNPNKLSVTVAGNYNRCHARSWTGVPHLASDAKYHIAWHLDAEEFSLPVNFCFREWTISYQIPWTLV